MYAIIYIGFRSPARYKCLGGALLLDPGKLQTAVAPSHSRLGPHPAEPRNSCTVGLAFIIRTRILLIDIAGKNVRVHIPSDAGVTAQSYHACRQATAETDGILAILHWHAYVQAYARTD